MNKPEGNYFYELLSQRYIVEFSDDPEIVFYSCYGKEHLKYRCFRIFYSPENWRPDFTGCDFAITFDYNTDPRHFRLPLWALYYIGYIKWHGFKELDKVPNEQELLMRWSEKKGFCCFIVSNPRAQKRIEFFQKLNKVKKVDSAGKHLNNIGYFLEGGTLGKMNFIKDYRFVISFENESRVGYTTEKLIEPLLIDAIPIYWGDPSVGRDFNKKRILFYDDFESDEKLIEKIMEIENNMNESISILRERAFVDNTFNVNNLERRMSDFLSEAIENRHQKMPVAKDTLKVMEHYCKLTLDRAVSKLSHVKNHLQIMKD